MVWFITCDKAGCLRYSLNSVIVLVACTFLAYLQLWFYSNAFSPNSNFELVVCTSEWIRLDQTFFVTIFFILLWLMWESDQLCAKKDFSSTVSGTWKQGHIYVYKFPFSHVRPYIGRTSAYPSQALGLDQLSWNNSQTFYYKNAVNRPELNKTS